MELCQTYPSQWLERYAALNTVSYTYDRRIGES